MRDVWSADDEIKVGLKFNSFVSESVAKTVTSTVGD